MIVVVRADANRAIGTGHVMRCLALSEYFSQAGHEIHFFYSECPDALKERWQRVSSQVTHIDEIPGFLKDAEALRNQAEQVSADWVILDGHHFGETYQSIIAEGPFKLTSIDDYGHCQVNVADLIINQNSNANPSMYLNTKDTSKLLLGPEYSILREEFRLTDIQKKEIKLPPENVLITTGGSDPENASVSILKSILESSIGWPLHIRVIAGALNPNLNTLKKLTEDSNEHQVEIFKQVDDIVGHMRWADLAISGAGTTLQELLQQGVPTLTLSLVQNQTQNAVAYAKKFRVCSYFGTIEEFDSKAFANFFEDWAQDSERLISHSEKSLKLVDGKGLSRILENFYSTADS